jgi:hypothetical protein
MTTMFDPDTHELLHPARAVARRSDPETSWMAARGVHVTRDQRLAFDALEEAGPRGLTDFELGRAIERQQTSAGKRRLDLQRAGLVEYADRKRPSPSGAQARVWRLIPGASLPEPDGP